MSPAFAQACVPAAEQIVTGEGCYAERSLALAAYTDVVHRPRPGRPVVCVPNDDALALVVDLNNCTLMPFSVTDSVLNNIANFHSLPPESTSFKA